MQNATSPTGGRLLRLLQLRVSEVPADTDSKILLWLELTASPIQLARNFSEDMPIHESAPTRFEKALITYDL